MKRAVLFTLLGLLVLLAAVFLWLAATESGLRWTVARVVPQLPVQVSMQQLRGRLIGPLQVEGLRVGYDGGELRVAHIALDWTPAALFAGVLRITQVRARGVEVLTAATSKPSEPMTLTLPALSIGLVDAEVEAISIQGADGGAPFQLARVQLAASVSPAGLVVSRLAVEHSAVHATLKGQLAPADGGALRGEVNWSAAVPGYPPLEGGGDLALSPLQLTLNQQLRAPARARLQLTLDGLDGTPRASARLQVEELATEKIDAGLPALRLRGEAHGEGALDAFTLQADIEAAHAGASLPPAQLHAALRWRDARAELDANWRDLAWPVAGEVVTSESGELRARGTLERYTLQLSGALRYADQTTARVHAAARGTPSSIEVAPFQLHAPGTRLIANGSWRAAALALSWELDVADLAKLAPQLAGTLSSRGQLRGKWPAPAISATLQGRDLEIDTYRVGALRAQLALDREQVQATIDAEALTVGGITLARAHLEAAGATAQHRLHAELGVDNVLTLDAEGALADGSWRGKLTHGEFATRRFGSWRTEQAVSLIAAATQVRLDNWCWLHERDRLCVEFDQAPEQLRGRLLAEVNDIGVIGALVPKLAAPRGRIHADLRLAGTAARPRITGSAALTGGQVRIPGLGIEARAVELKLEAVSEDALTLAAQARLGTGTLNVNGRVDFSELTDWRARLTLDGTNLEVVNNADARILASPTLTLQAQPLKLDLQGRVHVPEAQFHPRATPEAVVPSSDVVYVGKEQEGARWAVTSNVRLTLAEKIEVEGYNFKGAITGELVAEDRPNVPTTGRGELRVVEGEYEVYGTKVQIERGRLIFTDTPLDNPGLDVLATRRIEADDVLAGVRIRGTLRKPELTLYSEPGMSDTDVLAYLILGHPMEQATSDEGKMLYRAANAVGLAGGELLAQRVGAVFGVRDVRIEQTGKEESALVVGKYLSPGLYVSYGIGLFDAANTLRLRYQLSKHWILQTESGTASGADVLYTIER